MGIEVFSFSCPNCGSPLNREAVKCKNCGSALYMRETGDSSLHSENALLVTPPSTELTNQIDWAWNQTDNGKTQVYFLFKEIKIYVGGGISREKALQNFYSERKQKAREEMGEKWPNTLELVQRLCDDLLLLSVERRTQLMERYVQSIDLNSATAEIRHFFNNPTFNTAEPLAGYLYGADEADSFIAFVQKIRELMMPMSDSNTNRQSKFFDKFFRKRK